MKIEFNPQKNIPLLQDGRRSFVYSSNMAAVTSWEHSYYWDRYFHSNSIVEGVELQKTTFYLMM